jgi:hypothetical protein
MSPSKRHKTSRTPAARTGPLPTDAHVVVFYRAPDGSLPARDFIESCPPTIRARLRAVVTEVAAAPPIRFAGGGMWEAMQGDMRGTFEVRVDGTPRRTHYRLYCVLDYKAKGFDKPVLAIIDGRLKAFRTVLSANDYAAIKKYVDDYWSINPRRVG